MRDDDQDRPESNEGDTAAPRGSRWRLGTAHDAEEDAILEGIDVERGNPPTRRMIRSTNSGMRGIRVEVQADPMLKRALDRFLDRLVNIMIRATPDGGGSATRAYVVAREMQLLFRSDKPYDVLVSPDGARALATELDAFLPSLAQRPGEDWADWQDRIDPLRPLGELRDCVGDALAVRNKQRRIR